MLVFLTLTALSPPGLDGAVTSGPASVFGAEPPGIEVLGAELLEDELLEEVLLEELVLEEAGGSGTTSGSLPGGAVLTLKPMLNDDQLPWASPP